MKKWSLNNSLTTKQKHNSTIHAYSCIRYNLAAVNWVRITSYCLQRNDIPNMISKFMFITNCVIAQSYDGRHRDVLKRDTIYPLGKVPELSIRAI